jgi:hypothetical protein
VKRSLYVALAMLILALPGFILLSACSAPNSKVLSNNVSIDAGIVGTMSEKGADPDFGVVVKYYPPQSGKRIIAELIK